MSCTRVHSWLDGRQRTSKKKLSYLNIKRKRAKFHRFAECSLERFLFYNERGPARVALNFQHGIRLLVSERVFHKQVGIPNPFQVFCNFCWIIFTLKQKPATDKRILVVAYIKQSRLRSVVTVRYVDLKNRTTTNINLYAVVDEAKLKNT